MNESQSPQVPEALVPRMRACGSKKCGEYNMLRCCRQEGHTGEHSYVVDHENDYAHNKREEGMS